MGPPADRDGVAAAVPQVTVTPALAAGCQSLCCHEGLRGRTTLRQEGAALAAGVHGVVRRRCGREVHDAGAIARRTIGHVGLMDEVVDELRVGLREVGFRVRLVQDCRKGCKV